MLKKPLVTTCLSLLTLGFILIHCNLPEPPAKDTITGSTYFFMPAVADTGKHNVRIVAKDPSGLADTLTMGLTVSATNVPDSVPPVIKFQSPSKDTITSADSFNVQVICVDDSGCFVKGFCDGVAFTLKKSLSVKNLWAGMARGIAAESYSTIKIVATDSSNAKNHDSATVRIKNNKITSYVIKFDKNDSAATGTMADLSKNSGDSVKLPLNTFLKEGSIFIGWMTSPTGTDITYTDGAQFKMGTSSVILYAKWREKTTFVLTISATNGSVTRSPDATVYDSGTVVTLNPIPSDNYHFSGWSGALSGTESPATITMSSDKSLTARFEINPPNTFTLSIIWSNGIVKRTPDLPQYDSGSIVSLKAIPNTGYKFVSWSGDASGAADSTTVVINKGKNVTANFTLATYQLTVDAVNGTVALPAPTTVTVNHGVLTPIKAISKTGHSFSKWTIITGTAMIASDVAESTTVALTSGDATIRVNYTAVPYSVTFHSQGEVYTTAIVNYNSLVTEPAVPQGGACYSFDGWFTSETFTTK